MKKIAVFCGASNGNNPIYLQKAHELGKWLVDNNYGLVYGGGEFGLMGAISETVMKSGGFVDGIISETLDERGETAPYISNLEIVENISIRKQMMMDKSDGCIVLPGGPGTLEEFSQVYSWAVIGNNPKPCAIYNVNNYYKHLKQMLVQMAQDKFLDENNLEKLLFSESLDEIEKFMENYTPPIVRTYE